MSVIQGTAVTGAGGPVGPYEIERSLRFNSADSAYLNRTPASNGNRQKFTFSFWIKRSSIPAAIVTVLCVDDAGGGAYPCFVFNSNTAYLQLDSTAAGSFYWETTQLFRDVSAWYHIVWAVDTTQASNTNRMKLWVNGTQVTSFSTQQTITQSVTTSINSTALHEIGRFVDLNNRYLDGYLTEIHMIDGQQLDATSFGETDAVTGAWNPKAYSGSYGTNGFYLNFSDNASTTTLGDDFSGNNNDWTTNNFSVTAGVGNDSMVDTPTNYGTDTGVGGEVRGNYATWNSVGPPGQSSGKATFSNGNLVARFATFDTYKSVYSTFAIPPSTGKWYFEVQYSGTSMGGNNDLIFFGLSSDAYWTANSNGVYAFIYWRGNTGVRGWFSSGGNTGNVMPNLANNDILQLAYDSDTGKVYYGVNGTWYDSSGNGGSFSSSNQVVTIATTATLIPWVDAQNGVITPVDWILNAGQRAFAYTAPSGYKSLCTENLSAGTVKTSGSFTGNAAADGPTVYLNGTPTAMTINGNSVTFGTDADKLAIGLKLRSSSSSYNASGSNSYSVSSSGNVFKYGRAQTNP
jgi:hypothetical protein